MRKVWYVVVATVLVMVIACGVAKGGACTNPGDIYSQNGKVLKCVQPKGGGQPTWR